MASLLQELSARGFVADLTPGLEERLERGPIVGYVGFDPTADSLHVGNLVPVMGLAWLQRTGGTPIVLVGGGTGLIGDPSGKRAERPMMDPAQVVANTRGIEAQLRRFVAFDGPHAARMRNNAEWLGELRLVDFLREVGKHFTVNYMLQKESVKSRMEAGISFAEFAYMLAQAHDFWHLHHHDGCELQLGGSDQWGNITAGCELVARRDGHQVHGLVFPLLTTSTGAKFGKSEMGNVWLDPNLTRPGDFYDFWLSTTDEDVLRFLKLFTFRSLTEVSELGERHFRDPSARHAQRALAEDVTALVHGQGALDQVKERNEAMQRALYPAAGTLLVAAMDDLGVPEGSQTYSVLADAFPTAALSRSDIERGVPLIDLLVKTGLAETKADARRSISQKAFAVNRKKVEDSRHILTTADLKEDRYILLQKGKKHYAMIVIE